MGKLMKHFKVAYFLPKHYLTSLVTHICIASRSERLPSVLKMVQNKTMTVFEVILDCKSSNHSQLRPNIERGHPTHLLFSANSKVL